MIKNVGPTNRWDLLSREEYLHTYLGHHTVVASGIPRLVRYLGNPVLQDANGGDPAFDSMSEMYYRSVEDMRASFTDEGWKTTRKDHLNVVGGRFMFLATENLLFDKLPADYDRHPQDFEVVKYVALLNRKDGLNREQFQTYWLEKHVPIVLETPGLLRYRACPTTQSFNGDNGTRPDPDPAPWDGMVEMWFESLAAFTESFRHPYWEKVRHDAYRNFAMGKLSFIVKDNLILDRDLGVDRTREIAAAYEASRAAP